MAFRNSPINRQLEAYEEGWTKDHAEAMRCRDFEQLLAVGVGIFHVLVKLDVARRQRIAQGQEEYSEEDDQALQECFRRWLRMGELASPQIRHYESSFWFVDNAADFRQCLEETREIVSEWVSARRPQSGTAQEEVIVAHTSTPGSAAQLAKLLDRVSQPTKESSVPLGFDPDDYPLR